MSMAKLDYCNSFPVVLSFKLQKLFPFVPEILDIAIIFPRFLPN